LQKIGKKGIDETTFERIALTAKCLYPRRTSIRVISNQAVLAKLAADSDDEIRSAAAKRIDDPKLIAKLARDPTANVRGAAISRLADQGPPPAKPGRIRPDASVRRRAEERLNALNGNGKKK